MNLKFKKDRLIVKFFDERKIIDNMVEEVMVPFVMRFRFIFINYL